MLSNRHTEASAIVSGYGRMELPEHNVDKSPRSKIASKQEKTRTSEPVRNYANIMLRYPSIDFEIHQT